MSDFKRQNRTMSKPAAWILIGALSVIGTSVMANQAANATKPSTQAAAAHGDDGGLVPLTRVSFPHRVCNVLDYGAEGQRIQIALNTEAFQKAIDYCAAQGGGTVKVPAGNYLVAPLALRSNVHLHLAKDAWLVAASPEQFWRESAEGGKTRTGNGWLPFIRIFDAKNVAITGEGGIDGQGAVWWERWRAKTRADGKKGPTDRPRLILTHRASQVLIQGVSLINSPSFHIVIKDSQDVSVDRTRIITPWHAPHTDAIDPTNSQRIRITRNFIDCNDDHVAIKAEKDDPRFPEGVSQQIYIAHNTLLQGRGISIGSETSGGVSNVLVEDNHFKGSMYGLRIKSLRGKGGMVKNVTYRRTTMEDVGVPLVISAYYQAAPIVQSEIDKQLTEGGFMLGEQLYPPDSDPAQPFSRTQTPHFKDILIEDLTSTGASRVAGLVMGTPEAPLEGIVFKRVSIQAQTGMLMRHASVDLQQSSVKAAQGPGLILQKGANNTR
jgi:polygalacturonase